VPGRVSQKWGEPRYGRRGGDCGLDGLNLSRAWCMRLIAEGLPSGDSLVPILVFSATRHAEATLPHITSGNYEGEHWLATFAVYMLTE